MDSNHGYHLYHWYELYHIFRVCMYDDTTCGHKCILANIFCCIVLLNLPSLHFTGDIDNF